MQNLSIPLSGGRTVREAWGSRAVALPGSLMEPCWSDESLSVGWLCTVSGGNGKLKGCF